jgi:hypothetical protein
MLIVICYNVYVMKQLNLDPNLELRAPAHPYVHGPILVPQRTNTCNYWNPENHGHATETAHPQIDFAGTVDNSNLRPIFKLPQDGDDKIESLYHVCMQCRGPCIVFFRTGPGCNVTMLP